MAFALLLPRCSSRLSSDTGALLHAQEKRGWIGTAFEHCIARPLTGRPKQEAQWTMVAEHSDLRFIQRNGVFFEDNEGPPVHLHWFLFSAAQSSSCWQDVEPTCHWRAYRSADTCP